METSTAKITDVTKEDEAPKRPVARSAARKAEDSKPPEHKHPFGLVQIMTGRDSEGRIQYAHVQDRKPVYVYDCKACIAEDKARMEAEPTLTDEQLANTLFLVPDDEYDSQIARFYLNSRYVLEPGQVSHSFHGEKICYVKDARIVVVARRRVSGARWKRRKDEEGKWTDFQVPASEYIDDIVESAPIVVADCIQVTPASMMSDGNTDISELVARVREVARPHRVQPPGDPKDKLYKITGVR